MKKLRFGILAATLIGFLFSGCRRSAPNTSSTQDMPQANNAATNYVGSLQQDRQSAQRSVDKMNQGVETSQNSVKDSDMN